MGFDAGFGRPVARGQCVIGGGWRNPSGGNPHAGADIRVPVGTPVFAAASGMVMSSSASPSGDMGIYVAIAHANGLVTRYLHFSRLDVSPGQRVSKGQQIGLSGNTGNSAGPHLHFDVKAANEDVLSKVAAVAGVPETGFEPNVTGFGIGVPAEPWLPADGYDASVVSDARANGIPLYDQIPHGSLLLKLGLVAAFAIGGWWLWERGAQGGGTGEGPP